jgi:hypothetical protein
VQVPAYKVQVVPGFISKYMQSSGPAVVHDALHEAKSAPLDAATVTLPFASDVPEQVASASEN